MSAQTTKVTGGVIMVMAGLQQGSTDLQKELPFILVKIYTEACPKSVL